MAHVVALGDPERGGRAVSARDATHCLEGVAVQSVLVIEDEPEMLRFTERALRSRGYSVLTAHDGAEGLRMAVEHAPELVVVDPDLRGLSGSAVLAALLADDTHRRILVLARAGDLPPRVRGLGAGVLDFLPKPFGVSDLVERVELRLEEPVRDRDELPQQLRRGSLRLDLRTRRLHSSSRSAALSQREFELIQHLMRRAGTVCSRAELLQEVWGYEFDPGSNVVDVTVARLRAKIHDLGIETVRNVGYTLREA